MEKEIRVRRRLITPDYLELIRHLLTTEGQQGRTPLWRRLCRIWNWRQANEAYREIACRELFHKLEHRDLLALPPLLNTLYWPGFYHRTAFPHLLDVTLHSKAVTIIFLFYRLSWSAEL